MRQASFIKWTVLVVFVAVCLTTFQANGEDSTEAVTEVPTTAGSDQQVMTAKSDSSQTDQQQQRGDVSVTVVTAEAPKAAVTSGQDDSSSSSAADSSEDKTSPRDADTTGSPAEQQITTEDDTKMRRPTDETELPTTAAAGVAGGEPQETETTQVGHAQDDVTTVGETAVESSADKLSTGAASAEGHTSVGPVLTEAPSTASEIKVDGQVDSSTSAEDSSNTSPSPDTETSQPPLGVESTKDDTQMMQTTDAVELPTTAAAAVVGVETREPETQSSQAGYDQADVTTVGEAAVASSADALSTGASSDEGHTSVGPALTEAPSTASDTKDTVADVGGAGREVETTSSSDEPTTEASVADTASASGGAADTAARTAASVAASTDGSTDELKTTQQSKLEDDSRSTEAADVTKLPEVETSATDDVTTAVAGAAGGVVGGGDTSSEGDVTTAKLEEPTREESKITTEVGVQQGADAIAASTAAPEKPASTDGDMESKMTTAVGVQHAEDTVAASTAAPEKPRTTEQNKANISVIPYDPKKHEDKAVTIKIKDAKKNPETIRNLRRAIVDSLNKKRREQRQARRRSTTTTTTTASMTASETTSSSGSAMEEQHRDQMELSQEKVGYYPRRRRREAVTEDAPVDSDADDDDEDVYTEDDVEFIEDPNDEGTFAIVVRNKDGDVADNGDGATYMAAEELATILEENKEDIEAAVGTQVAIEKGPPDSLDTTSTTASPRKTVWEAHFGLFLTIIILLAICIIITIICCICVRCRSAKDDGEKTPMDMEAGRKGRPGSVSSPIPDDEIVCDEAPMLERENPALTRNGGGQHISKFDDDGWVVPLDELSGNEQGQPEVENTRL